MTITYWSGITLHYTTVMDGQNVFNPQENSPTNKLAQNETLIFVKK